MLRKSVCRVSVWSQRSNLPRLILGVANRIGSDEERRHDEQMKDDIRIGYLGGVQYAFLNWESKEMRKSPVVTLSFAMLIPGHILPYGL